MRAALQLRTRLNGSVKRAESSTGTQPAASASWPASPLLSCDQSAPRRASPPHRRPADPRTPPQAPYAAPRPYLQSCAGRRVRRSPSALWQAGGWRDRPTAAARV
eukprot:scaffold9901_cov65-Phaeocystis_antarctica.AAC.7